MRISKGLFYAALSLGALAAATPASAQRVDRIVAFGDSYADDGNLFELLGIPRPAVYPNGRFSNGINFVDEMGRLLSVPIDNFAIGGAFTGNGNINGPGIAGFVTEYNSFLAGGGPAAFPRVSGTFDADDLVVVSIGGNDARAYERSLGLNPSDAQIAGLIAGIPPQASARVAEATAGLGALVNAGARNITFLAGDVGRLPEVAGLPVAAVGSAYASAFNNGMQASLATFANQGVIVNYLDLNAIGDVVEGNLAAFNLISAGACPIACVTTNPTLLDRYLFYVDQVHLTSAGFAIVGRYAVAQLDAPLHLEAQADVGLQVASTFGSAMQSRLDLSGARFGTAANQGLNFYISGNTTGVDRDPTATSHGYKLDASGASFGGEYEMGGAIVGAAVNYSQGEADMSTGTAGVESTAWQAGIYAGWSGGGAFVQGYAGYGWVDYDMNRPAVIDQTGASTDGSVMTAGAQAGYLIGAGPMRVGPVIGLRYAKAELDAFTENGDPALTLNVDDQELDSLIGSAGVEARWNTDVGGLSVQPFAAVAVEKELAGDARTIRYALTTAPGIVNQWQAPARPDDSYARLGGGINFSLGRVVTLQVAASTTIGSDHGDEKAASLALRLSM